MAHGTRAAALFFLVACGAEARPPQGEPAKLRERLDEVQRAACLRAATQSECDPGLYASFGSPPGWGGDRKAGSIWCEGGRPRGHFIAGKSQMTGEFGQVIWEAIWRAVESSGSCASAYGGPVEVTRNGEAQACRAPRFNLQELFEYAYFSARRGPKASSVPLRLDEHNASTLVEICKIDPIACPGSSRCPRFYGDLWNGAPSTRDGGVDSGAPDEPGASNDTGAPDESDAAGAPSGDGEAPSKPTQAEVMQAIVPAHKRARGCMSAGTPTARAVIVFQSDGTVQSVSVTGLSAGSPAEACVKRAFGGARVPVFPDPTHTVTILLRGGR